jgi:subtilisin family serine protease
MAPRLRRHAAILAALVVVAIAAACVPVTPPPAPKAKPKPTPTTLPAGSVTCQAVDTPEVESSSTAPDAATYEVVVDDGVGAPEFVAVDAVGPAELEQQLDEIEVTIGPVTEVAEEVEVGIQAVTAPQNDPRYGITQQQRVALDQVHFDDAWTAGEDGAGVVVAVVDTGVQGSHPDLYPNLLNGYDFVSGAAGPCADPNSHGTHVAGIIAQADNSIGGIGGAPRVKILPVRVLGANGSGSSPVVASGITWAADHGADVINLSLGGDVQSSAITSAVDYAVGTKGVVVVAAAGNCGQCIPANTPSFPAASANVIAVGALTTGQMSKAGFSNNNSYIDIATPGTGIDSTVPTSSYGTMSGTSMATPFASAAAALILRDCALSPAGVLARLQASATQAVSGFAGAVKLLDAGAAASACS